MEQLQHTVARSSIAGSVFGAAAASGGGRRLFPDFEFSLGAAKVKVLKGLEEQGGVPSAFVRFYNSSLLDRLLHGLVLYFVALFQQEQLAHWADRAGGGRGAECLNPQLLSARVREVEEEVASRRGELSQPYCEIILKHSSYRNQQQDKRFFESLYSALCAVLHEAFDKLGKRAVLEQELGRLFRGRHFNVAARVHGPQRSVDSMTVMQMYEVKNKSNRALHSQLISSLFEKAPALSVQVAAVSNSPLVSQAVNSPLVARSRLADPLERDTLLALPYCRTHHGSGSKAKGRGAAAGVRADDAVAAVAGLGVGGGAGGMGMGASPRGAAAAASGPVLLTNSSISVMAAPSPSLASAAAAAAGLSGTSRASTIKPFQGLVAALPEAAGLPVDENYAHLCLLRRSVLYGPTLGLPTGPTQLQNGGRSGMMSMTGSAAAFGGPGQLSSSNSVVFRMM